VIPSPYLDFERDGLEPVPNSEPVLPVWTTRATVKSALFWFRTKNCFQQSYGGQADKLKAVKQKARLNMDTTWKQQWKRSSAFLSFAAVKSFNVASCVQLCSEC